MTVFNVDLQVVPSLSNSGFHLEIRPREIGPYSTNPSTLCWNLNETNYHEDSNQKNIECHEDSSQKNTIPVCQVAIACKKWFYQKILLIVHGMPVDTSSSVSLVLVFFVFSTDFCGGPSGSPVPFYWFNVGFFSARWNVTSLSCVRILRNTKKCVAKKICGRNSQQKINPMPIYLPAISFTQ